jgi:Ca2+-binding EF-hand superfamily protein
MMISNSFIFEMAHKLTAENMKSTQQPKAIQGVENFKSFLVHLFTLSILWVHFRHADNWQEGEDVGNEALTIDEFRMACRTFSSAQANEVLTEEKILADFTLLDVDHSGTVDFAEVCTYCAKFVEPDFADLFITAKTAATKRTIASNLSAEEEAFSGKMSEKIMTMSMEEVEPEREGVMGSGFEEAGGGALNEVMKEMVKNEKIAAFEEIKINTEILLGVL